MGKETFELGGKPKEAFKLVVKTRSGPIVVAPKASKFFWEPYSYCYI